MYSPTKQIQCYFMYSYECVGACGNTPTEVDFMPIKKALYLFLTSLLNCVGNSQAAVGVKYNYTI